MAVTLNSTGITFSNGTAQATEGTLLSAIQGTAYLTGQRVSGQQGFQTTIESSTIWAMQSYSSFRTGMQDADTTVFCGFGAYRTGTTTSGDSSADAGVLSVRVLYRSVGLA